MIECTTRRIGSLDDLRALRDQWNRLAAAQGDRNVFLTCEWVSNWREHFHAGSELYSIAVSEGSTLRALVPLELASVKWRGLPVRELRFIQATSGDFHTYADFLCDGSETLFREVFDYLGRHSDQWDVMRLDGIPAGSPTLEWLQNECRLRSFAISLQPSFSSYYLPTNCSWESYLKARSSHFRKHDRYYANKLGKLGEISVQTHRDVDNGKLGVPKVFDLYAKSWKKDKGTAAMQRHHSGLVNVFGPLGQFELSVLELDGRPIASLLSLLYEQTLYTVDTQYDSSLAAVSPGYALLRHTIKDAMARGLKEIDWSSAEPHVERWTDLKKDFHHATIYNRRPYSRVLRRLRQARQWMSEKFRQGASRSSSTRIASPAQGKLPDLDTSPGSARQ